MVFFVNVACDLYARKHNIRMEFPACPTVAELINTTESQFDVAARSSRPAGYPDVPFRVQTFQVYDDVLMRWVDLYSSAQLTSGCQVYCFQPETVWTVDLQGTIPVARDTVTWQTKLGSPHRARLATDHGIPPTMSEKLRAVFFEMDAQGKGYALYTDMRAAFERNDIDFSYATVGELFTEADRNRDGHVTYEEWVRFAIDHPNVVDALFFRARDVGPAITAGAGGSFAGSPPRIAHYSGAGASALMAGGGSPALNSSGAYPGLNQSSAEVNAKIRARERELAQLYQESKTASERERLQSDYDVAKREADLARSRAQDAADRERAALDKLYFAPGSPPRSY